MKVDGLSTDSQLLSKPEAMGIDGVLRKTHEICYFFGGLSFTDQSRDLDFLGAQPDELLRESLDEWRDHAHDVSLEHIDVGLLFLVQMAGFEFIEIGKDCLFDICKNGLFPFLLISLPMFQ